MQNNQPIGILGGTFDPIHLGHIHLANEMYQRLHLQTVRFIPCYQPVHRNQPLASPQHRLAMVKLAVATQPEFQVDDREIRRGGPSYMIDTLFSLREEIGANTPLCLIMAADAFAGFDQWHHWQEMLELTHIVVASRPDHPLFFNTNIMELIRQKQIQDHKLLRQQSSGYILLLDIPDLPISATEIRALLASGKKPNKALSPQVLQYIKKHKLYRSVY